MSMIRRLFGLNGRSISLRPGYLVVIWAVCSLPGFSPAFSELDGVPFNDVDLTALGIEELMKISVMVTSAAKKPQALFHTPSAIYVLSAEDIRRSGATGIPDLLRMVPGVQVAQINVNKWAISIRGFNGRFSSKLLVMIDGRNVYSPLFSGVYWDTQETPLEDIERIEVIRGPGGSLWGTNAVNGVINIITRHSRDTQGGLLTAGAGNEERAFGYARYGGKWGDGRYYRLYAGAAAHEEGEDQQNLGNEGCRKTGRVGFRTDRALGENEILFQGDYYHQHTEEWLTMPRLTPPYAVLVADELDASGGYLQGRWQHGISKTSDLSFQVYYDYMTRENLRLPESRHTLDLDFQHRFSPLLGHEIVWGIGYRRAWDEVTSTPFFSFDPERAVLHMPSAFIQDSITLIPDYLVLGIGTKVEYNIYSGIEWQPSAQLLLTPDSRHATWVSVTRAVRTPDRIESDSIHNPQVIPGAKPMQLRVFGNDDMEPEEVLSYELGYRTRLTDYCSADIALFHSDYNRLRTFESKSVFTETAPGPEHRVLPIYIDGKMEGKTSGVELALDVNPFDGWRLRAAYSYLDMRLSLDADSNDTRSAQTEGHVPQNQFSLRSLFSVSNRWDFDFGVRFVDKLETLGVEGYWGVDARVAWRPIRELELSLVARDLFDNGHPEWAEDRDNRSPTQMDRSLYGKITWKF